MEWQSDHRASLDIFEKKQIITKNKILSEHISKSLKSIATHDNVGDVRQHGMIAAIEMRYFWLLSQEAQKMLAISQHPGAENMGNFPSKAHSAPVCRHVHPYFANMKNSPLVLPQAPSPSSQQGCAEILGGPYICGLPLPRIPISCKLKPDDGQTMSVQATAKQTSRA